MNDSERLDFLIRHFSGGNAREFSKETGINPSSISKIRNGTFHIGRYVGRICSAFPSVNQDWLETGEGESGIVRQRTPAEYEAEIARLNNIIDTLIDQLAVKRRYALKNAKPQ